VGAGVYEIQLGDGVTRQIASRGEPLDARAYSLRRVTYESTDRIRVPMTLVSRAEVDLTDSPPVLIHVYGAYGFTWVPYFNPMFRAFLAAGGVLAVPNIRGGGIYGQGWYEAGRGANKIHSVDDTVSAARWLLANGHANPGRLAVLGNSAGSIPAAVAAVTHPELFGALLLEVPLADMVRYPLWTGSWNTEFAAPDSAEGLAAALAVSPYHLLRERTALPAAMITAGDRDRVAFVAHAYKLAAALQWAQSAARPSLLHVDWGTGHGADKTARQRIDTWSYELAFLFEALGMEPR
jgi:prolyl oligopeptidase